MHLLNRISQIQRRYWQRPFWFRAVFQKGHSFLYRVFRKLSYVNFAGIFVAQQRHKNPGFFFFKKDAASQHPFPSRSPVLGGRLFCFLSTISRASKRAPEEMEVTIEESKQSKFQAKQNQTGIPFLHRASCPDGEACLYSIPTVRGMPLSWAWFSVPGWGWRMYAHATDETI